MPGAAGPYLFEVSWEVANKVGGIHTVIRSKLPEALRAYGDRYVAVGPWLPDQAAADGFQEAPVPVELLGACSAAAKLGITVRYGSWCGAQCALLDWTGFAPRLDGWKAALWEKYGLDTLGSDPNDFDTPLAWSLAAGLFVRTAAELLHAPATLHAHEWLSGGAVAALDGTAVRTVFTTHATVLGRALSSGGQPVSGRLVRIRPETEARAAGVGAKHGLERLAATAATVFTTVSGITADEAAAFLGRRPRVIENGIEPVPYDISAGLRSARERQPRRVMEELLGLEHRDGEEPLFTFTMGRYEVRNKGYDTYLAALGALNREPGRPVVAAVLVPGTPRPLRPGMDAVLADFRSRGGRAAAVGEARPALQRYRESVAARAPVSPYFYYEPDELLRLAASYGLDNADGCRVKLLTFPNYLDGADPVFGLTLYELIAAFDLGVFPSLYEPWGYTPMEAALMGVPTITSDQAGFGLAAAAHRQEAPGVTVLHRAGDDVPEIEALASVIREACGLNPVQLSERRVAAYQAAARFSWHRLFPAYVEAYGG